MSNLPPPQHFTLHEAMRSNCLVVLVAEDDTLLAASSETDDIAAFYKDSRKAHPNCRLVTVAASRGEKSWVMHPEMYARLEARYKDHPSIKWRGDRVKEFVQPSQNPKNHDF